MKKLYESPYVDHWIVGFFTGESSFSFNKNNPTFSLEHSDKDALGLIKRRLNCGLLRKNVLERSPRKRDVGKKRKTMYTLTISSKQDIRNLIAFLDFKNNIALQGFKHKQYLE